MPRCFDWAALEIPCTVLLHMRGRPDPEIRDHASPRGAARTPFQDGRLAACAASVSRLGLRLALAGVLGSSGCGGASPTAPTGPGGPVSGGSLTGRYLLELHAAAACVPSGASASFSMLAAPAGTSPYPGVQLLLERGEPASLELELKYVEPVLEGGIGTTGEGVASSEGPRVWVNAIGTGHVTQVSDGRGEVTSGSLRGYLEIEGMNACTATNHSFRLRPQ